MTLPPFSPLRIKAARQSERPRFTISLHSSIDSGGMVPYSLLLHVNAPEFNAFPSHVRLRNMTVKLLHTSMPGLGRNVFGKKLYYCYKKSQITQFRTASMSSKVASDEVRKLFPDPFPCGPRYLL